MVSGSSNSPSPTKHHTRLAEVSTSPRAWRYRLMWAWAMALRGPSPIDTVGYSQNSGISRGWG